MEKQQNTDPTEAEKPKKTFDDDLFYWLQTFVLTLVAIALIFTYVARITIVKGDSMFPTLINDELLLVWSLGYTPKQGDIIILNKITAAYLEEEAIVKRVVAVGGQTVEMDYQNNQVLVDGVPITEDYIYEPMREIFATNYSREPVLVPEGSVYVLGDNRNATTDSRDTNLGTIDHGYITGKAVIGLWPISSWRIL